VSGVVLIPLKAQIKATKTEYGVYYQFIVVAKHSTKLERLNYKLDIFVPAEFIKKANEKIQPGAVIQVRHGDLLSHMIEGSNGPVIFNTVSTKWHWIEFLTKCPTKEKQGDK
jgi:hypothetical protein